MHIHTGCAGFYFQTIYALQMHSTILVGGLAITAVIKQIGYGTIDCQSVCCFQHSSAAGIALTLSKIMRREARG